MRRAGTGTVGSERGTAGRSERRGAFHTRADDVRAAENRSLPAMNYFARGLAVDVGLDC